MEINWDNLVLYVTRWIHVLAGITWIGLLYFFNFVNGPFEKTLDPDSKKKVVPQLRPRALWWFRWGAMVTFLMGLFYIYWAYMKPGGDTASKWMHSTTGQWLLYGAGFGTIMWFNVWFVIWPAQKKLIGWIKNGEKPPEMDSTVKRAFTFSRINTYLSAPMLFGMIGSGSHFLYFSWKWALLMFVVGLAVMHGLIKMSAKVGKDI